MEQKLFTELRPLYTTSKERPNEIRIRIRMRDMIDPEILRHAVDTQKIIRAWIDKNLVNCEDPGKHGKGLTANRSGQWRYRIGDYRLICSYRR